MTEEDRRISVVEEGEEMGGSQREGKRESCTWSGGVDGME